MAYQDPPGETIVEARSFINLLEANVDNARLTDEEFREFVRNSLPIVQHTQNHLALKLQGKAIESWNKD